MKISLLALLAAAAFAAGVKTTELRLPDGAKLKVDVVDDPLTRERGLMHRKSLPRDYGMLFVFPRPRPLTFWMKNTFVPLDMVFIGPDKRVTVVHRAVPASRADTPDAEVARAGGDGQYVLELPAGAADRHKLAAGQRLDFEAAIPPR